MIGIALWEVSFRKNIYNKCAPTHAIQAPRILQLILPPYCRNGISFLLPKVTGQLFGNRCSRKQRPVQIESNQSLSHDNRDYCSGRGRLYIAAWNPILSDTRTFDSGSQTGSRIASPIASPIATSLDNIFTRHNVSIPELKGQLPSPDPIDIIPLVGSRSPRHRVPR